MPLLLMKMIRDQCNNMCKDLKSMNLIFLLIEVLAIYSVQR